MPAATPLPRGPSVLTLYSAADLLTAPGCPVCRYAAEAADRYFGWFALEGHSQPDVITGVRASLGMCAAHTRRLMRQPGSAARLTAVYRYVVTAARDRLAGRMVRLAACPACEHDAAATGRALDTLLEDLADNAVLHRCQELGGLCIPHLGAAAAAGKRSVTGSLTQTMLATIEARPARPGWLAGTDPDADARAVLRRALPATGEPALAACTVCLAAAQAERDQLARLPGLAGGTDPALALCAAHLADAAMAAGTSDGGLHMLLAWQAGRLAARVRDPGGRGAGRAVAWLRAARGRQDSSAACDICRGRGDAARRALADLRGALRASHHPAALCVRHLLVLRAADPGAGQVTVRGAAERASLLISELAEAFQQASWANHRGAPPPPSAAWRRAAAFLDGDVFAGCRCG